MCPACKEQDKNKKRTGIMAANVVLTLVFAALLLPLLRKGSLSFLTLTAALLGLLAILPLVLRPWQHAPAAVLLLHDALLLASSAAASLVLVEYLVKGCSIGLETSFWQGWLVYLAINILLYLITGRIRISVCVGMAVAMAHGLIDHYVLLFRGTPVLLSDVYSIGTAANVAESYSAPVELSVLWVVGAAVLYCACVCLMQRRWKVRRLWTLPGAAVLAVVVFAGLHITDTGFNLWQSNKTYSEIYYFLRCAVSSAVSKPNGYTAEKLDEIESNYQGADGTQTPNLIVIMNESFADLQAVGEFETNEDYMPFVHSMLDGAENTVSGELLVSTFGGGTSNTEFEFLTGSSMGFLPYGTTPYQVYLRSDTPGLVSGLAKQGYRTVSLHPYSSSSWNREKVYEYLGFDEQLYDTDFPADVERIRTYISDHADYQKVIELYENKQPDEPLFLFNVTMQNHGGYDSVNTTNFEERIHLTGEFAGEYPQVDQYLSLVRYSDEAIRELVEYFADADEPTAIVFFGDHQPGVTNGFYDELLGEAAQSDAREPRQVKLVTPFFIWANYDIEEAQDVQISANYLAAYALDTLGCATSAYDALRLQTRQAVPRVNNDGFYTADGEWHAIAMAEDYAALTDYRMMQYTQLFDHKNRNDAWYETAS